MAVRGFFGIPYFKGIEIMKFYSMAKAKKKRADHYDPPLKIEGSFGDVIKVAMTNPDMPKEKPVKRNEKTKK